MRVALIHDTLIQYGGPERVLETLLQVFPEAHLYTLLYSPDGTWGKFEKSIYKTSALNIWPIRRHPRLFTLLMPRATQTLHLDGRYDLIISHTSGYARGVMHDPHTFHLSYCYTPLSCWEPEDHFGNGLTAALLRPGLNYLKTWDFAAAQRPNVLVAVSRFIAEKLGVFYGRDADVVYPPVNYKRFYYEDNLQRTMEMPPYYLAAGRTGPGNNFDLLMDTFRQSDAQLLVVGAGPWQARLAAKSANIRFVRFVTDGELHALYNGAKAFIAAHVEDFAMAAAEAQACGTPVIALAAGGALEIVQDEVTGIFFKQQTSTALMEAIRLFEGMYFDRRRISRLSQRFSEEAFTKGILAQIPPEALQ